MIIEKKSGMTYEAFLQKQVWQPLGMTHTFVMNKEDRLRKDIAIGYDGFNNKDDFNVLTYGTNGVYSSAEDLFRWSQSMSTNLIIPFSSKKISYQPAKSISGKVFDLAIRGNTTGYGFAQFVYKDDLDGVVGHSGAFGGFYNILLRDMKNDRDVILLTNNGRVLNIFAFGNAILHILRGNAYQMPKASIDLAIRKMYYNNIDKAIEYYYELKNDFPDMYQFDNEWELNRLGYALIEDHRNDDAIKIFKLLVSEFPDSTNPHDSLGEAYFLNKQYELAIESYQQALQIDGGYFNADQAREMIKKGKAKLKAYE